MGFNPFGIFNRHSVTGLVLSTFRNFENDALYVTLRLPDNEEIRLEVNGELSVQIETLLIARKQRGESTTLTLVYDPGTYEITSFSVVS
ncbi:hypothetical protein [Chloroflexus sp.]|uniref:hypothetical protein n=1 Tax=Chloroflexus sp. TaxID=1904827 RepID=UPI002ACDBA7A|nr:hypothetical protein [Chloroflexus sp.]